MKEGAENIPIRDIPPAERGAGRLAEVIGHEAAREAFEEKEAHDRAMRARAIEKWEDPQPPTRLHKSLTRRRRYSDGDSN